MIKVEKGIKQQFQHHHAIDKNNHLPAQKKQIMQ